MIVYVNIREMEGSKGRRRAEGEGDGRMEMK